MPANAVRGAFGRAYAWGYDRLLEGAECTVREPERALGEVVRVLRPDGRFLLLEHVRSDDPGLARWQNRLERPWGVLGRGCHPNRDTLALIGRCGLQLERHEGGSLPGAAPIVRPLLRGVARAP